MKKGDVLKVLRERYLKAKPRKRKLRFWMNIATIPVRRGNMLSRRHSLG